MRVMITGGVEGEAAVIAAALLAGGLEVTDGNAPYDLRLVLGGMVEQIDVAGGVTLDLLRGRATREGVVIPLTPLEFALLAYLGRLHRPASRAELLRELWDCRFDPGTNSVAVHVSRLRAKIGRNAIVTGPDGYRLGIARPT